MMSNLERWGAELAMLLRREAQQRIDLDATAARIETVCAQIQAEPSGTLYGAGTGEHLTVERNSVGWAVRSAAVPEQPKPRNEDPVPMPRPMREGTEHLDGGSTFALTPIGDTVTMPAIVPCPRTAGGDPASCGETMIHMHFADGTVQQIAKLGDIPR